MLHNLSYQKDERGESLENFKKNIALVEIRNVKKKDPILVLLCF